MRRWWFSLAMIPLYSGIFHVWMWSPSYTQHVVTGSAWCVVLAGMIAWLWRRGYFAGWFDLLAHALVVLDVGLEAVLVREHTSLSFYGCTLGFVIVVGAYRCYALRRERATAPTPGQGLA
jgi:hypothetical protein